MDFLSIEEIYKKSKNKYLACVLIAKRAKKYHEENYTYFIKGDIAPPEGVKRTDPMAAAVNDFRDGKLDEKIKENE